MVDIKDIETLNVDGKEINVSETSEEVQNLVAVYNSWRREVAQDEQRFKMGQAALRNLSNEILATLNKEAQGDEGGTKVETEGK